MYLGLTTIKAEKEDRKNTGGLIIAISENLPQSLIQFIEIYLLKTTVTFV